MFTCRGLKAAGYSAQESNPMCPLSHSTAPRHIASSLARGEGRPYRVDTPFLFAHDQRRSTPTFSSAYPPSGRRTSSIMKLLNHPHLSLSLSPPSLSVSVDLSRSLDWGFQHRSRCRGRGARGFARGAGRLVAHHWLTHLVDCGFLLLLIFFKIFCVMWVGSRTPPVGCCRTFFVDSRVPARVLMLFSF